MRGLLVVMVVMGMGGGGGYAIINLGTCLFAFGIKAGHSPVDSGKGVALSASRHTRVSIAC